VEQLRGRNALVTGAAGGLGRYIARALAAEGVNLVLSDLPATSVDDLVAELSPRGVKVEWVPGDLTDTAAIEELAAGAEEAIGPLDILVNNAGVEFAKKFVDHSRAELEAITSINLLAVMELTRVVLPGMLERGRGHVVNIASVAGKIASPYLASYAATKHGVVGFTHSLRAEHGPEPVGFTAICPGFITRVGMYGRLENLVPDPPRELSTKPPEAVGEAVVNGIRDNRAEIVVANTVTRVGGWLSAAAPQTFTRLARNERMLDYAERFVQARDQLDEHEPVELDRTSGS
jgi:short-subunit dehydrogenase